MRRLFVLALLIPALTSADPTFYGFTGAAIVQGPDSATIAVPDVFGDDETTATTTITGASLAVGGTSTGCSTNTSGTVIRTVPTIGTLVAESSNVFLVLSTGTACTGRPGVRLRGLRMRGL